MNWLLLATVASLSAAYLGGALFFRSRFSLSKSLSLLLCITTLVLVWNHTSGLYRWYFLTLTASVSGAYLGGTLSLTSRFWWSKWLYPLLCSGAMVLVMGIFSGLYRMNKAPTNGYEGLAFITTFLFAVVLGILPALFAGLMGHYSKDKPEGAYLKAVSSAALLTFLLEFLALWRFL